MNNLDYTAVFALKRKLCSKLRRMVKPLLWGCGFVDHKEPDGKLRIFSFETAGMPQEYYVIRNAVNNHLRGEGISGFTRRGVITDGYGGALVTWDFETIPLEDLIRIENFLIHRIDQFKALRKAMKERALA